VLLVAGCAERGDGGSLAAEDLFGEWFLAEDRLTLTGTDGRGLVYRAES
jgi:hypothetical protein